MFALLKGTDAGKRSDSEQAIVRPVEDFRCHG